MIEPPERTGRRYAAITAAAYRSEAVNRTAQRLGGTDGSGSRAGVSARPSPRRRCDQLQRSRARKEKTLEAAGEELVREAYARAGITFERISVAIPDGDGAWAATDRRREE